MRGIIFTDNGSLINEFDFPEYEILPLDYFQNRELDEWMHNLVFGIPSKGVNIFIPLSIGLSLSNFLGLRLAIHVRTTPTPNQLSNIFLYGTESLESIISDDYSLILRTKGVSLIDNNLHTLMKHSLVEERVLNQVELISELGKIQLKIPADLYDSHSVGNIWGMYRMLEIEGIELIKIKSLSSRKNKLNNIYFKWLIAINATSELKTEEVAEVKRAYSAKLPGVTILGKIDLSRIKGK